ncbi:hypothetical protein JCM6882_003089 [Rhodosporidiobolus microsporus]
MLRKSLHALYKPALRPSPLSFAHTRLLAIPPSSSDPRSPRRPEWNDKAAREKDNVLKLGAAGLLGLIGWWWWVQRREMKHDHSKEGRQ